MSLLTTDFRVDMAASQRELERNFLDHFCREAPRILSSLLQGRLRPVLPSGPMDPDVLDRICQSSTQECTTQLIRLLTSGSGNASHQPNANSLLGRHFEEPGPSGPYSLAYLGSDLGQAQSEINGHTLHTQHSPTSQGYPFISEPDGGIASDYCYSNMDSAGQTVTDYYQSLWPGQPDLRLPGAISSSNYAQLSDFVSQNTSSLGNLPFVPYGMPYGGLDHVYS
jgi:hypothetical protein